MVKDRLRTTTDIVVLHDSKENSISSLKSHNYRSISVQKLTYGLIGKRLNGNLAMLSLGNGSHNNFVTMEDVELPNFVLDVISMCPKELFTDKVKEVLFLADQDRLVRELWEQVM